MTDDPPVEYVPQGTLRTMFNEACMWHRAIYGDLYQECKEEGHPSPPLSDDPICTLSQIVAYRQEDTGRAVAEVHQYKRPDGRLGGTAQKPDPHWIIGEDGVLYIGIEYPDAEE
jgi:hypothetical protein